MLKQNVSDRAEWLAWRHSGIGGSDASCLHGASPYKTRYELGEEKLKATYEESPANFAAQRGIELEPIARGKFSALWNMENGSAETFEAALVEMKDLSWMKASLDGISKDGKIIVEFKYQSKPGVRGKLTAGQQAHLNVTNANIPITSSNSEIDCRVRYNYWIQIQHQLLVSGAEVAHFVSYDGETLNSCTVLPDTEFMKKHLELCTEFWKLVMEGKSQPLSDDDYKEFKNYKLIQEWKRLKLDTDLKLTEMEDLREQIIAQATEDRMICNGVSIVKYPGNKGSVDYQKILKEFNLQVDLEKYRKNSGKEFWKIEVKK